MVNEVKVVFMGMCLWWLHTNPGPFALLPDLGNAELAHSAVISAPPSAFVSGRCPSRFTNDRGSCTFTLNGAGAAGGVAIAFLTNSAANQVTKELLCDLPTLPNPPGKHYKLAPASTPPNGTANAAWMRAEGGRASSLIQCCPQENEDNCPRGGVWNVPVTADANVAMTLSNLKNGAPPIVELLETGATVTISNTPSVSSSGTSPFKDWCAYFNMVTVDGETVTCIQPPVRAACSTECVGTAPHHLPVVSMSFTTIACSNSQYP